MISQPRVPEAAICLRTLGKLCAELGPESVDEFIAKFTALWPIRITRLQCAFMSRDGDAGEDAALSMKSAATMAGAYELARLAVLLQGAFRAGHGPAQDELIARIQHAGTAALGVLEEPGFTEHALRTYRESQCLATER